MPVVDGHHYDYSESGMRQARAAAKRKGLPVPKFMPHMKGGSDGDGGGKRKQIMKKRSK